MVCLSPQEIAITRRHLQVCHLPPSPSVPDALKAREKSPRSSLLLRRSSMMAVDVAARRPSLSETAYVRSAFSSTSEGPEEVHNSIGGTPRRIASASDSTSFELFFPTMAAHRIISGEFPTRAVAPRVRVRAA